MRTDCGNPLDCLGSGGGLADDFDIGFALEQLTHPAPNDLVIVEQEYLDNGVLLHGELLEHM
ncbi:unannotated protein [freshwater metagenome]|uniref:Unannotated protein n=1 Tax=freshwater metagenome TaxID=449393 RepID=A0A6J6Y3P2_9ZZZZ